MIVSQELHSYPWEKWGRGGGWENGYTLTTLLEEQEGELKSIFGWIIAIDVKILVKLLPLISGFLLIYV
jgi:hypothetical protein